ncbi:MAG TPA: tail fiber domain-containing protein, partial [Kofleriaceae bacterium]|nr:tail fiber domain-containing protein [Kofleriaceae bacterium]
MRFVKLAGLIAVVALAPRPAAAQVPGTVTFTARVVDNGTPITGTHQFTFKLYDAVTAGTMRWQEAYPGVIASQGLVTVALGSMTPLSTSVLDGDPLWVEITLDGDIMAPRLPLRSVPYAVRTGDAATVGGLAASAFATAGHNHDAQADLRLASKLALSGGDSWLRLNQSGAFTSGVHTPYNLNAAGVTVGALYYDPGAGNLDASGVGYFQGGARLNGVAIGTAPFGAASYPYETIQLDPSYNLRFNFGANERMLLGNDGRLWMGSNPGDCPNGWFCNGNFWDMSVLSILYNGLSQRSDARLKQNIRSIESGLDTIMALRPVTFEWRDPRRAPGRHHGFIAQEVQPVIPELVTQTSEGTLALDTTGILPSVVRAVQELKQDNDRLRAEIAALRGDRQATAAPSGRWPSRGSVLLALLAIGAA